MAVQAPRPRYTEDEKRLIALLSRLVLEAAEGRTHHNALRDDVLLSDAETEELILLLDRLLSSGEFAEEAYFIESLHNSDDRQRQRVFEKARRRRGRSASMGWLHYNEFKRRFETNLLHNGSTEPMTFDYFMQMEHRLLTEIGTPDRVRAFVLDLLQKNRSEIEAVRAGERGIAPGAIRQGFQKILNSLRTPVGSAPIRPERVAGAFTLVTNLGCLFTSRDWGVAGTISTIGGATILTMMS